MPPHIMSSDTTDPNKIDRVIELVREAWRKEPGFRLTQLLMVVTEKMDNAHWFVTDEMLELRLRAFSASSKYRVD